MLTFANVATGGSVGRAGTLYTEAVPLATGLNPPVATTPDQSIGMTSGVGSQAPYCGSPLLLAYVVKVNYK